ALTRAHLHARDRPPDLALSARREPLRRGDLPPQRAGRRARLQRRPRRAGPGPHPPDVGSARARHLHRRHRRRGPTPERRPVQPRHRLPPRPLARPAEARREPRSRSRLDAPSRAHYITVTLPNGWVTQPTGYPTLRLSTHVRARPRHHVRRP